jgi:hypothetical protein
MSKIISTHSILRQIPMVYRLLTVFPAKVTVEPVLSFVRRMVELAGAEIPLKRMLVQDATAVVI